MTSIPLHSPMTAGIEIIKIWADEDMIEFSMQVCDGHSLFSNDIYVDHRYLADAVGELDRFKDQIHGGIYDLKFGTFGPESASGGFHSRMHFQDRGKIFISIHAQSAFADVGKKHVASEATLYIVAEPTQLDEFIRALRAVSAGHQDHARLSALPPD